MKLKSATALPPNSIWVCPLFAQALNAGELDEAAACFARDGCLVTPDATAIYGRERIREVLAQMVRRQTEIQVELSSAVGSGKVVLVHQRWRILSGDPLGERLEQISDAVLVVRQVEGNWKLSIAAPWGYGRSYG
ncbi:MAG TPA: nuclear transport factor 2 family protein [Solirubrobacterales bacterium]|nr:nuclear transport factor 2 family protein [Solirubrobacterales bacterium]